jgi:tetratricopeptide (TPR) repeat protein/serine/threonine protein kinase
MTERDIFIAALQKEDPAERQAYLEEACTGQPALRRQVESLLQLYESAGSFLERPAAGSPGTEAFQDRAELVSSPEAAGTTIGPYKLIELIGEGGMGAVWMAQQTEPVRRVVALKLIKAGMDSKQVLARFEAERQALALMDHPNIARVLDAGTTSSGRPYFVMDLVKGAPITTYCDEHRLTPRQRLELFIPICQAVQHAHQKGVIHRDLKPSNVLVAPYDGRPVPKVIDFGVAKATGQQLTDQTLVTGFGALVGTPEYMSPEQAELNNRDIDTRSDIYALGVLLYELLTGVPPFSRKELEHAGMLEMLRVIREQEPTRPSTKLSTADGLPSLAASRSTEPAKLTRLVRGELDWIVMKALEKDRTRRYETANGFVRDIQRYLADEPVEACPPSTSYKLRKFVQRNKRGLAVAALVLFLLVLSGSSIGWAVRDRSAREAENTRQQEERQAKVAAQVASILAEVNRLETEQKWPEALLAARRAEAAVTGGEADPATTEMVRQRLRDLEFVDRLERIWMRDATLVGWRSDTAGGDRAYAGAFHEYGVDVDVLPVETSIDLLKRRPALVIILAAALDDWSTLQSQGSEADVVRWKRLKMVARGIDPDPLRDRIRAARGRPVANIRDDLRRLAESIDVRGQHPATLKLLAHGLKEVQYEESAIRILRSAQYFRAGDFSLNFALGLHLWMSKDYVGAIRFWTAAVAIRPNSAAAYNNLGNALRDHKELPEAIAAFRKAIELDTSFALPYYNLGLTLNEQEKLPEAIEAYRKAIELDPKYAAAYNNLGCALRRQKNLPESIEAIRTAIELDPNVAIPYYNLGLALGDQEKLPEAIEAYRKAIKLDPKYTIVYNNLGIALRHQKRLREAVETFRIGLEQNPQNPATYNNLGNALNDQMAFSEAVACYKKAVELDPKFFQGYMNLGDCLQEQKKLDEAVEAYRKAIKIRPNDAVAHSILGNALCAQKKFDEAVACCKKAVAIDPKCQPAHAALRAALMDQGKLEEARAAWKKSLESDPADHEAWYGYAELCLFLGKEDTYRRNRTALLKRFGNTTDPVVAERTSRACLLLPATGEELKQAVALADRAVTLGKDHQYYPFFMAAKALAEYRLNRFESALHWGQDAGAKGAWVPTHLVLAMAHQQLGHTKQARESLATAVQTYDWKSNYGIIHALRREAEELLNKKRSP